MTDLGVPYTTWFEAIPFCVKALRKKDPRNEAATMLEIKYNIRHRRWDIVQKISQDWIRNVNSECTYCYYALTMNPDTAEEGLSWAKKGLRTKATGYMQLGLLNNAMVSQMLLWHARSVKLNLHPGLRCKIGIRPHECVVYIR